MKDVDGRPVEVHALYHANYASPSRDPHAENDPYYWNFLEMEFDPQSPDPKIAMRIRNLVDGPNQTPRGGGTLETTASQTGRKPAGQLPAIKTLANADVYFTDVNGTSLRGTRSDSKGNVFVTGLVGVRPGAQVMVNAYDGTTSTSQVVTVLKQEPKQP